MSKDSSVSRVALYRKYRPGDVKELVGQDHVATSLENALKQGRISHAYLFTGPRGVGKTSTARILARRINGLKPEEIDHLDIIEIDAASNRKIDEIRELREKVHLAPARGKYKVYIIDEVHMLTAEAFNALLKTLEEPPAHAIFILATTEPHKLPETIISRTQRYSFRPVANSALVKHLAKIAGAEGIKISDDALAIIAAAGEGSVRDCLSILDQVANLSTGKVEAADVSDLLGLSDQATTEQLAAAVFAQDPAAILKILDGYQQAGGTPAQLLQQLLRLLHHLLRCQLQLAEPRSASEQKLAEAVPTATVAQVAKQLAQLPQNSAHLDIALEAALIELAGTQADTVEPVVVEVKKAPDIVKPITAKVVKPVEPVAAPAKAAKPAAGGKFSENIWPKVLTLVKQHNNSLYALLRGAAADLDKDTVNVRFRFQFHKRRLDEVKNKQLLEKALQKVLAKAVVVEAVVDQAAAPQPVNQPEQLKQDKEAVNNVLQILGGEIVGG